MTSEPLDTTGIEAILKRTEGTPVGEIAKRMLKLWLMGLAEREGIRR